MAPPENGQKNKMSDIKNVNDEENSDWENEIDYDLIINSNIDVAHNESSSGDEENEEGFAYEALPSNPNTNETSEIYDENGQVAYKQLNSEDLATDGDAGNIDDNALFDEFQLLAESRFKNKVKVIILIIL